MQIHLEEFIAASPERVWSVLGTSAGMRAWFALLDEYEPRAGGRIAFHYPAEGEIRARLYGEVIAFEPPRRLAFTWRQQDVGESPWPEATLVDITLHPDGRGTRVKVVHSGFEKLGPALGPQAHRDYSGGWTDDDDLGRLKRLAESEWRAG